MNAAYQPSAEFETLLAALADDTLSVDQQQRLAELLRGDPQARLYYLDYLAMLTTLRWDYSAAMDEERAMQPRHPPSPRHSLGRRWAWFLAAAATLATALIWTLTNGRQASRPLHHSGNVMATLTDVSDAEWATGNHPADVGEGLSPGRIALRSGIAEIMFDAGARVRLEGPVELELVSADRAILHHGKLSAWVPPEARGFTVDAPGVTIVDLGTTFALSSDGTQFSEAHTFQGEVVAMIRATAQQPAISLSLLASATKRVEVASGRVTDIAFDAARFLAPPEHNGQLPQVTAGIRLLGKQPLSVAAESRETYRQVHLFLEREEVVLPEDIHVSFSAAGRDEKSAGPMKTIPRGTRVQTYLLHFNRHSSPDFPTQRRSASVTFARPILGLICRDEELNATDAALGNPAVAYPHHGARAFNPPSGGTAANCDMVMITEDRRTLLVDFALVKGLHQVRVLVEAPQAVPDGPKSVHGKKAAGDRKPGHDRPKTVEDKSSVSP
jgi:hypothetical protein